MFCSTVTCSELRPTVLVVDSGVGGLSVYAEIRHLLPNLHYIYSFDNIAFPYGEKSKDFIIERVIKIISAVQQRYPLALAIIACNTASTVSLPSLRKEFQFSVVGVVPAIRLATRLTVNGIIGLLATRNTIKRFYTHELINNFAKAYQVTMLGSTELVRIAEGKLQGEAVSFNELRRICYPWLCMTEPPDTIVLGCTHFPLLQDELIQVLPEGTRLIDSGSAIAHRVAWLLEHEASDAKSSDANIALCTAFTKKTKQLLPILNHYGFGILERLPL